MSRAQLTSTVEQNTGGAVAPFVAGKNKIINGSFDWWQRGTSIAISSGAYFADRWTTYYDGSGSAGTVTQQAFTPGAAPVAGYESQYYLQYAVTTAGSGSTYRAFAQPIENVQIFAGQTVTLSFWAKATVGASLGIGVTLTQKFGSGGSSQVQTSLISSQTLTSGWVRYVATATLPSISGKTIGTGSSLNLEFYLSPNNLQTIQFWGVQLEAGSVATPFTTASNTLQGELALCQRYYWRQGGDSVYQTFGSGWANATNNVNIIVKLSVTMRTTPTVLDSANLILFDQVNAGVTFSGLAIIGTQSGRDLVYLSPSTVSGLTQYRSYDLAANNSTSAYIGFGAEL
jgi:hypothetical protein